MARGVLPTWRAQRNATEAFPTVLGGFAQPLPHVLTPDRPCMGFRLQIVESLPYVCGDSAGMPNPDAVRCWAALRRPCHSTVTITCCIIGRPLFAVRVEC